MNNWVLVLSNTYLCHFVSSLEEMLILWLCFDVKWFNFVVANIYRLSKITLNIVEQCFFNYENINYFSLQSTRMGQKVLS